MKTRSALKRRPFAGALFVALISCVKPPGQMDRAALPGGAIPPFMRAMMETPSGAALRPLRAGAAYPPEEPGGAVRAGAARGTRAGNPRPARAAPIRTGGGLSARPVAAPRSAAAARRAPLRGESAAPGERAVSARFLWSGLGETNGNLANRFDVRLSGRDISFRAELLDRRYSPFREGWREKWEGQVPAFSAALYHAPTGSRLLFGVLEEWGLSARLKNMHAKSLAYPAARKPLGADLKTEYSATGAEEWYLYLSAPFAPGARMSARPYASFWLDETMTPAFGAGLETRFSGMMLRTEGFYTRKTLAPSNPSTWFSEPPPLPERDAEIMGAGVLFTHPWVSLAADGALSRTFARGEDYYGNLAVTLGSRAVKLSLAAESVGALFTDRAGTGIGAGFRTGGRFEWKQSRSGLFRLDAVLRAPAAGEAFNRSSLSALYRFPARPARAGPAFFRPGKIGLSAARDGRDRAKILDTAAASLSWRFGPVGIGVSGSLDAFAREADGVLSPFPAASGHEFSAAHILGELSWSPGALRFGVRAAHTWHAAKAGVWEGSVSAAVTGPLGRLSLKISPAPEKWEGSLSWRLVW
jgi:hypothetical protein